MWRYDLRAASEPHDHHGQPHVGVLHEADWYRVRRDPTFIAVPSPVPLDLVWVEQRTDPGIDLGPEEPDQSQVLDPFGPAARVVETLRPPVRRLRIALFQESVLGCRAALNTGDGQQWGLRVCSEPYLDELPTAVNTSRGIDSLDEPLIAPIVTLCSEAEWYAWAQTGQPPHQLAEHALYRVWVE